MAQTCSLLHDLHQARDPLPPTHDPLIPSSCDIRFLDTTHERKKMTDRQRTCLSLRIGSTPVRYLLLMHVFEPSGNPACSGIHIRKHPPESCTRTEPHQYVSVGPNQALATTFWSPVILNDIGHCPSCRVREAHTRCPFYERERQNRCSHPPDSNDEPSLAPRYRCRSGR